MAYTLLFAKSDTIAVGSTLNSGATSTTLTSGNFGSPSGAQIYVVDYDVSAKAEIVLATVAGTAVTSITRGLSGGAAGTTDHAAGAKFGSIMVPQHYAILSTQASEGWMAFDPVTLTYASATTFTTSVDLSSILSKGDKIKFTQTSAKYFYITSISGTTVTVTGGTDYTVANAAITAPYYSKAASPAGHPIWFNYTPTWTGTTTNPVIGDGAIAGYLSCQGSTVNVRVNIQTGASTTYGSGFYIISLPLTAKTGGAVGHAINGGAFDTSVNQYFPLYVRIDPNTSSTLRIGAHGQTPITPTAPFTWAASDILQLWGAYEF